MKIILSNTSRGAYRGVVNCLKSNLGQASDNIVIAPDRFTASVEKGLISSLEIESTFGINVMSFTRLANKLLGNDIKKCLTPEGSVMLLAKVISDVRKDLKYYGRVALADGFASELYAALTAVRNSGISAQELEEAACKANASLKAKAQDIALIYNGYLQALEGKHSDSSTRLYALAELIEESPECVSGINFYCTDIYDFSAPELEIIKGLSRNALSLTIGLTSGRDNPNKRIYPDNVVKKLVALCDGKAEIEYCNEELDAPMKAISTKLFAYVDTPKEERVENNGKVALRCAKDRYDETMSLVYDVLKRVRNGGRYKDFEVYVSDMSAYESELTSAFDRYGIRYFIDKKEMLAEQARTRYLLQAIACVRSNFRRRETLDFVKNPLFYSRLEGGEEEVYLFENYCLEYNVEYVSCKYENEFTRCKASKNNLHNSQKEGFIAIKQNDKVVELKNEHGYEIPESVRKTLICVLEPLVKTRGGSNIKLYVDALRQIMRDSTTAYSSYVDKLAVESEYYRKVSEQVDKKINDVLDEIYEVLDYETEISGFETVFKSMLKTLKIALVPTYLDCVFVGDADSRFSGDGDIYVMGANNAKLPRTSGGGCVITPKDEDTFRALGIELTPDERQKIMTEMYAVCDLMKKPRGRLVVSYPESGDGGALRPSTIIFELQNMLCENGKPLEIERVDFERFSTLSESGDVKYDMDKAKYVFATKRSCYNETLRIGKSGRASIEDSTLYGSAYMLVDDEDRKRIENSFRRPERIAVSPDSYFAGDTSVSRLESFYGCPYSHYFNYILSLKRRKDGNFEGTENGTILHFVLEKFFADVRDGKIKDDNIKEKACEYFYRAIEENDFEVLLEKPDTGRLLNRVKEEGIKLCADLFEVQKRSKFRPYLLEAKIGKSEIKPMSLDLGDRKINLKGTIDRIDVLEDKFLIIDYKTYKSADLSLKELYGGQKIQLYVYMRAVEKSITAKPSGVFYFPVFSSFTGEDDFRYKYKGQASDSKETLENIDSLVAADYKSAIVPYKTDKKGEKLNPDVHLSQKGFDTLGDYAIEIASKGAKEIANGYIKPSPIKDKCKKCDFADICAYKGEEERKLPKVKGIESFELNKEEDDNE